MSHIIEGGKFLILYKYKSKLLEMISESFTNSDIGVCLTP